MVRSIFIQTNSYNDILIYYTFEYKGQYNSLYAGQLTPIVACCCNWTHSERTVYAID